MRVRFDRFITFRVRDPHLAERGKVLDDAVVSASLLMERPKRLHARHCLGEPIQRRGDVPRDRLEGTTALVWSKLLDPVRVAGDGFGLNLLPGGVGIVVGPHHRRT